MSQEPHDDGRDLPEQRATEEETLKAAGATAATGAGCLFTALMPWSFIALVFLVILVVWVAWKFISAPGSPAGP